MAPVISGLSPLFQAQAKRAKFQRYNLSCTTKQQCSVYKVQLCLYVSQGLFVIHQHLNSTNYNSDRVTKMVHFLPRSDWGHLLHQNLRFLSHSIDGKRYRRMPRWSTSSTPACSTRIYCWGHLLTSSCCSNLLCYLYCTHTSGDVSSSSDFE